MRILILSLSLFLFACSEQNTPAQHNKTTEPKQAQITILALGDSLTEGLGVPKEFAYPALLQKKLHSQGHDGYQVINSGLSGETSSGLKARLDWVLQTKPAITILTIGANDAMRGIQLELVEQNINDIIVKLKSSGSKVILGGMTIYNNLGEKYVNGFQAIYPKLAEQHQLPLIPFFLEGVAGDASLNQADGIHPTTAGYQIIVDQNIWPALQPILNKTTP